MSFALDTRGNSLRGSFLVVTVDDVPALFDFLVHFAIFDRAVRVSIVFSF